MGIRFRTKRGFFSRFNPTRKRLQKQLDRERGKDNEKQDKGLIQTLLDALRGL
jgi:hypothetical protein